MKEGYIQNMMREQKDKICSLENEIKTLKTKISFSKKEYDEAKNLMTKAIDIDKFKNYIIRYIKDDVNKDIKQQYHFLANNNQKALDELMKITLKRLSENYENEMRDIYSLNASLIRVLLQKNLLSINDVGKISKFSDEIRKRGFDNVNTSLIEEIKKF